MPTGKSQVCQKFPRSINYMLNLNYSISYIYFKKKKHPKNSAIQKVYIPGHFLPFLFVKVVQVTSFDHIFVGSSGTIIASSDPRRAKPRRS